MIFNMIDRHIPFMANQGGYIRLSVWLSMGQGFILHI